ncbi:hypothetical protein RD110_18655 [Rhodoferax koreense]|uniref:DUF4398 domain-containing protein n=1 Tax=Rhodoferax koreensis TaxID=1842727 RepID=A0A1P8JYZ4_9BURK|nr:hypothetical protein [Rhodoferax koreense]APW38976.1 hypothetical protein RD110_18655 [Rhodoferax koreense]
MSKKLIALAAIAAAAYFPNQPAYAEAEKFEMDDDIADRMVSDQVAKLDDAADAKAATKLTKARLLVDSALGNANDVVELDAATLKQAKADSLADNSKEAVAYALTLPQNKPPA